MLERRKDLVKDSKMPKACTCPRNALQIGACTNVLNAIDFTLRSPPPPVPPCCWLIAGLADLEAAVCLCTALEVNVLGINVHLPIDIIGARRRGRTSGEFIKGRGSRCFLRSVELHSTPTDNDLARSGSKKTDPVTTLSIIGAGCGDSRTCSKFETRSRRGKLPPFHPYTNDLPWRPSTKLPLCSERTTANQPPSSGESRSTFLKGSWSYTRMETSSFSVWDQWQSVITSPSQGAERLSFLFTLGLLLYSQSFYSALKVSTLLRS
ncbi:hypothetical protein F2Q70_00017001 [Brassica cretica]|uniref:Hydrophobic seed protein domain-containing protein n=1 Tax=Brassica cretica TaxID=69181 RepID=A0A8S9HRE4_BRACR|nr:hypothetical protein F2Q70_00017001 [Brassica cretica]